MAGVCTVETVMRCFVLLKDAHICVCRKRHTVIYCDTHNLMVVGCRWTLPNWMKRIMKG